MNDSGLATQQLMIEHVLGLQSAPDRAAFEARLARDPELAEQVAALREALTPLEAWEAPEPPPSFVEAILDRVENTTPLEYVATSTSIAPEAPRAAPRRSIISLRGLVALAACLGLLITAFAPGMARVRSRQLQALCANNLASFYQGHRQYAASFDGRLPSMPQETAVNFLHQPNRHHLLPAIRLRFILPKAMYCPSAPGADEDIVMDNPAVFLNRMNIRFYSTQNRSGPMPRFTTRMSMPMAADVNPVFEDGRFHPDATRAVNSRAHDGRGQNVLFLDGSTSFLRTPIYGAHADNIWQVERVQQYFGTEAQRIATDAFLIP